MVQSPMLRSGRYYSYSVFWDADERKVLNISHSFEFMPITTCKFKSVVYCCILIYTWAPVRPHARSIGQYFLTAKDSRTAGSHS